MFKRVAASVLAALTAVAGLSLATATPAEAATGRWRAYGNTSPFVASPAHWACGTTYEFAVDVFAQTCAIRPDTRSRYAQGAVIVRNNRNGVFGAEAAVSLSDISGFVDRWICSDSGVAAHTWSVCFGTTLDHPDYVVARGGVNGFDLGLSLHV